jgi:ribosomal protein L37E
MNDSYSNRNEEVKAALKRRFPDMKCLRCGSQRFGLRIRTDDSYFAIPSPDAIDNVADFICDSCGFIETHLARNLINN